MNFRPLLLALVLCLGLSTPALPSLHAETTRKKKKKSDETTAATVHHRHTRGSDSATAAAKAKAPGHHRVIPATSTAVDEEPRTAAPIEVDPSRPPTVLARSVILINARTGETLFEKNADEPRQIASTTKLMTALLVAEAGNLRGDVTVEPIDTVCEPTKLYFKPGEHYARNALLYALLVHSCNDVARCLARDNAGSFDAFADKMNARAAQLGARDTHFVTPNGLPAPGQDQHSTARDLSHIARTVYFNQTLRPIMATQHLQFQMASGKTQEFANTNKVLLRYPYCNGMKTGYTDAAGHCLVSSADDGTNAVISVCLGDSQAIWNDSQKMLAYGLAAAKAKQTAQNQPPMPNSPALGTASGLQKETVITSNGP